MLKIDVKILCIIARVSRSGYYKWLRYSNKPEKDYNDYLLIKDIFDKGKSKYGFRTIQMKLLKKNIVINHKKIIRIMKKYRLIAKIRRINPYKAIMKKTMERRTFENKLNREFDQTVPFRVFCADITYLPLNHRFVYLSVIKDIASGEIMAWNLTGHLEMDLVINTIKNMKNNNIVTSFENIMIHSDKGFHYTNPIYIKKIEE